MKERTIETRKVEARLTVRQEGDQAGAFEMFIPYNQETRLWWFREIIRPGFFARAIQEKHDVVAWYQHGEGGALPLGRTVAGTLTLEERIDGMLALATPPSRPWVEDLREAIERNEVNGASFAFEMIYDEKGRALGERWTEEPGEDPLRELTDAIIWDVSPVVFPAYPGSEADVRTSAKTVYERYRTAHPAPDIQADEGADNDNQGDTDQADDVTPRTLELTALEARYRIPKRE